MFRPVVVLLLFLACCAAGARADSAAGLAAPGTNVYPDPGMTPLGGMAMQASDGNVLCSVIDTARGYAYFGTNDGLVVKLRLSDFKRVAVSAAQDLGTLGCVALDPATGFLYFGTNIGEQANGTQMALKFAPGAGDAPPTLVASITLDAAEGGLFSCLVDSAAGFVYYGTQQFASGNPAGTGRIIKLKLSDLTRAGSLTLATGEIEPACAALDAAAGFAYFGTFTDPARVVKVKLSDFSRVGAITLGTNEKFPYCALLDAGHASLYLGIHYFTIEAVKIDLTTFTRVAALPRPNSSAANAPTCGVIDPAAGYAYFGSGTTPGRVHKVRLSDFTLLGETTLASGEGYLRCAVIDPAAKCAYFSHGNEPSRVVKVALGTGDALPERTGAVVLHDAERAVSSMVTDPAGNYAYIGAENSPFGRIIKIRLSDLSRAGQLDLPADESQFTGALMSPAGDYAYFHTDDKKSVPNHGAPELVKIRLSDFSKAGSYVGAVNACVIMDPQGAFAYSVVPQTSPGKILKIRLSDMTSTTTLTLNSGENNLTCGVMDPAGEFAYFTTLHSFDPAIVVKVRLSDFTRVGALTLNEEESNFLAAAVDPSGQNAYFLSSTADDLVKIRLSDFSRVGALAVNAGAFSITPQLMIDGAGRHAYIGGGDDSVYRVSLDDFALAGRLDLNLGDSNTSVYMGAAAFDPPGRFLYFGTISELATLQKIGISNAGAMRATRFNMPEVGRLSGASLYSHAAGGRVRMALYDNDPITRHLLWQSYPIANAQTNGFVSAQAAEGSPGFGPVLQPGNYWLAWQTDSANLAGSLTAGTTGDGFYLPMSFGGFPTTIFWSDPTRTAEKWTETMTYVPGLPVPANSVEMDWTEYP